MNADELLAHNDFLLSLARRLVLDEHRAADITQKTWLAALQHPPAEGRPAAPWLSAIMRNMARMVHRSEARLKAREKAASVSEGIPSSEEIVEQEEIRRKVVDAVLSLDEPFRSPVVLRYYKDLPLREVARRIGVPIDTMRSRLKKGMALLAARLDASHGGDRQKWLVALASVAGLNAAASTAGAAAAVTAGATAFSAKLKIAAAVLLAAAAALTTFLVVFDRDEGKVESAATFTEARLPAGEAGIAGGAAGEEEIPERVAFEEENQAAPSQPANVSERTGIRGRCLDGDGVALFGVRVTTVIGEAAETGSDGVFTLIVDARGREERQCHVIFSKPGHARQLKEVTVRQGQTLLLGDVIFSPGGSVSGRVVDQSGVPVSGAKVFCVGAERLGHEEELRRKNGPMFRNELIDEAPPTGSDGTFRYAGAPIGWVRIWARAEGTLYSYSAPIEVLPGRETAGVELVLDSMTREDCIAGRVVSPDGEPVPYARIQATYKTLFGGGSSGFSADKKGMFEYEVDRKVPHTFIVSDPEGRYGQVMRKNVKPGTPNLVFQLAQPRTLHLDIRTAGERPLGEATVWFLSPDDLRMRDFCLIDGNEAGEDGQIDLPLPADTFSIRIEADGFQVEEVGPFDPGSVPDPLRVELTVVPGVTGRVVANGKPAAGVAVSLHAALKPNEEYRVGGFLCRVRPRSAVAATTDEEGRFFLGLRESGTFYCRAVSPGYAPAEKGPLEIDFRNGAKGIVISLGQGGTLEGKVWTTPGRDPAGIIVGASRGDAFPVSTRTGADGIYRFEKLAPGRWQVEVRTEEVNRGSVSSSSSGPRSPIPWSCEVTEGEVTRFDIDLAGGTECTVQGTLTVNGNRPAGWRAVLTRPDRYRLARKVETALSLEGTFSLAGEGAGIHTLLLIGHHGDGPEITIVDQLDLGPGETTWSHELELGRIEVRGARLPAGERGRFGFVKKGPGELLTYVEIMPNKDGSPVVCSVPAGKGSIILVRKTYQPIDFSEEPIREVDVPAGGSVVVDLQ